MKTLKEKLIKIINDWDWEQSFDNEDFEELADQILKLFKERIGKEIKNALDEGYCQGKHDERVEGIKEREKNENK